MQRTAEETRRSETKPSPAGRQTSPGDLLYLQPASARPSRTPLIRTVAVVGGLLAVLLALFLFGTPNGGGVFNSAVWVLIGIGVGISAAYWWVAARLRHAQGTAASLRRRLASAESNQALWVSLSAVLHDIRNPLHNVTLLVETLGAPAANPLQVRKQVLEELERIHLRMRRVMSQVAEFSGEIERKPVLLRDIAREVDDLILPLARRVGISYSFQCMPSAKVVADARLLVQAIDHLLLNSLQILAEQPVERPRRLMISVATTGDETTLLFDDSGPGLPESVRARPFEPLTTSQAAGMGLGLTIAHALARAAGGDLMLGRSDTSGTQFRLRLVPAA